MAETQNVIRHDIHDDLPVNDKGVLTRQAIIEKYDLGQWQDRSTVTAFGGSRSKVNSPLYAEETQKLGEMLAAADIGLVTGGAPEKVLGLMSLIADPNPYLIGVSPQPFADRGGLNSGMHPGATNFVTYDFYVRKVFMDLLCRAFVGLPGGYGTLEEIVEGLIYGSKTGKAVNLLNVNGYWNNLIAQLHVMKDLGFIRRGVLGQYTASPTAEILLGHIERQFREAALSFAGPEKTKIKPGRSLQSFLRENPHFVSDAVFKFVGADRPRIGIIVSGNISGDTKTSCLKDDSIAREFCRQSAKLGEEVAQGDGVLVLSGGKDGLRQIMAEAALNNGGSVIWIQDGKQMQPLSVASYGRELTFTVTRKFERAMLFDLIAQSSGFLPGGIHTLDRVFEIVTREQCGFAGIKSYQFMTGDDNTTRISEVAEQRKKPNSVFGLNVCNVWTDIDRQIDVFTDVGYVEPHQREIFQLLSTNDSLARALINQAKQSQSPATGYDLLAEIAALTPRVAGSPHAGGVRPGPSAVP